MRIASSSMSFAASVVTVVEAEGVTRFRGRLLDLRYEIVVSDPSLGAQLREVYRDSADDSIEPDEVFSLTQTGPEEFVVLRDGARVDGAPRAAWALGSLHWHINRRIVATSRRSVLVHAGALDLGGRAVLVVGASGTGKSTATASLAMAGLGYLTDDVSAISPDGLVAGAPKPLGLRAPSIGVLGLEPSGLHAPGKYAPDDDRQRFVAASSLGADVATASRPGLIVFLSPELPPGRALEVRRSLALARLTEHAFDLDRGGRAGFLALSKAVRGSTCWEWGRSSPSDLVDFVKSAAVA